MCVSHPFILNQLVTRHWAKSTVATGKWANSGRGASSRSVARHSKVVNWAPRGHRVSGHYAGQLADYSVTDPCWLSSVFPAFQVIPSRVRERVGVDSRAAIDASFLQADPSRDRGIQISSIHAGSDVPPSIDDCQDVAPCRPLSAPMGYDRACFEHVVLFVVFDLDPLSLILLQCAQRCLWCCVVVVACLCGRF